MLHTQTNKHKMSLTDYGEFCSIYKVVSRLSAHVMLFRCTLGVSDCEKKSLFISPLLEHLASLNDLSQDAGCVQLLLTPRGRIFQFPIVRIKNLNGKNFTFRPLSTLFIRNFLMEQLETGTFMPLINSL